MSVERNKARSDSSPELELTTVTEGTEVDGKTDLSSASKSDKIDVCLKKLKINCYENKNGVTMPMSADVKSCTKTPLSRQRKTRSLYGVSPICKFGPKALLQDDTHLFLKIPDPGNQKLSWHKPPLTVLIVRKLYDAEIVHPFRDIVIWLIEEKKMVVFADSEAVNCSNIYTDPDFQRVKEKLIIFEEDQIDLTTKIDFLICLGGDGTLIHASSLFQQSVPPVMAFNMGSLGFLTPFQFEDFKEEIDRVLNGNASLLLRYRLKCHIARHDVDKHSDKNGTTDNTLTDQNILVLNEVVVDRGSTPYLCNIDLYIEGRLVTSVQGDGLIISTPTGSTAYAVAAGASMIHPNVPCILITPICPHSLSFRPIVVPAGVEIKLMLSPEARSTAWVSFDGRSRHEIKHGDSVRITTATYPIPSICAKDQINDWFDGLADCLHWNIRKQQKHLSSISSTPSLSSLISEGDVTN